MSNKGFLDMEDEDGYKTYYKMKLMKNKQTAGIFFHRSYYKDETHFDVGFAVANKKKDVKAWYVGEGDLTLNQTGKCGLEALTWAKQQIIEFENYIKEKYSGKKSICVGWDDSKRKRVYLRGLQGLDFKLGLHAGYKELFKDVV